jgi:DNA-binding transcriptional LysR family regulator
MNVQRYDTGFRDVIDKLEYLVALADTRHFGRAAERCGVTQPTLSTGIKQLERLLGLRLVQRGSRFIGLTPAGEEVLDWANHIVADVRTMRQEIKTVKSGLAGHLKIAVVPPVSPVIVEITTPFLRRHPDVQFTILRKTSAQILPLLESREVDAGITYLDSMPSGRFRTVPLYNERYRLVISKDALPESQKTVTWAEVAQIPLCLMTSNTRNRQIHERLMREAGHAPTPTLESDSMLVLFTHVRTGRWASVMSAKLTDFLSLEESVRVVPIVEPDVTIPIGVFVPPIEPMTSLTTALVQQAKQFAARMDA